MARPKESNEQKVKKVYPDAECVEKVYTELGGINQNVGYSIGTAYLCISELQDTPDASWQDALIQIRKTKIKAAKDKRKPIKVPKEIKKHVGLTMYPTDKAIIVKGFGSVQKFLDSKVNEYKLTIKTK